MKMNVELLFGLCIVALFCNADSAPRWSWGSFANLQELHQKNKTVEICSIGRCVKWTDCPAYAIISNTTKSCSNKRWGPWICCLDINGVNLEESLFSNPKETPNEELSANNSESTRMSVRDSFRTEVLSSFHNLIKGSNLSSSEATANEGDHISKSEKLNLVDKPSSDTWINSSIKPEWIEVEGILQNGDTNSDFFRRRTSKTSPTPGRKVTRNYWNKGYDFNPEAKNTKFPLGKTTERPWLRPTKEIWQRNRPTTSTERKSSTSWSFSTKHPLENRYTLSTKKSSTWGDDTSFDTRKKYTSMEPKSWNARTTTRFLAKSTTTSQNWNPTPILEKRSTKIRKTTPTPRSWVLSTKQPYSRGTSRPGNSHTSSGEHRTTPNLRNKHTSWNRETTAPSRTINTAKWSGRRNANTFATKSTVHMLKLTTAFPSRSSTSRDSTPRSTLNNRRSSPSIPKPLPDTNINRCGIRDGNSVSSRRGRSGSLVQHPDSVIVNPNSQSYIRGRSFQRIVGGKEAEPFSWPWVAALYRVTSTGGNSFLSAGSLINEHFVLTAAHVFTPEDLRSASFVVMLGTHTAKEAVAEHPVLSVLRHPEYQRRFYYNDIALLRLARPVEFSNYVMPVCLPTGPMTDTDLRGKRVTVMGWGDESYGGITSRVLKEASFPIAPRRTCNASYVKVASNRFPKGITDSLLCAGDPDGGKDACQGDSGGPLTTIENGRYTQVGIVSFGYRCGDKDYPGVYTRVSSYLNWIEENADCNSHRDYDDDYYGR